MGIAGVINCCAPADIVAGSKDLGMPKPLPCRLSQNKMTVMQVLSAGARGVIRSRRAVGIGQDWRQHPERFSPPVARRYAGRSMSKPLYCPLGAIRKPPDYPADRLMLPEFGAEACSLIRALHKKLCVQRIRIANLGSLMGDRCVQMLSQTVIIEITTCNQW